MRFINRSLSLFSIYFMASLLTGCTSMSTFWEDTKSFARIITFRSKSMIHKDDESQSQIAKRDFFGENQDFIPLNETDVHHQKIDFTILQPKEVPGRPGGKIPGISAFFSPSKELQTIFKKIYFETDQHTLRNKESLKTIHNIALYLKKHPDTYIFIEGNTDERASEAYNLTLGTRRSNFVRKVLIKEGVNPEQLYTISYGKERPEMSGHNEKAWAKNRRVSFKIYQDSHFPSKKRFS